MPALTVTCLLTVGAIAGNHYILNDEEPANEIKAYLGQPQEGDPVAFAIDEVEMGERVVTSPRVVGPTALSSDQLDFAARRWQSFKDEATRAKLKEATKPVRGKSRGANVKKAPPRTEAKRSRRGYSRTAGEPDLNRSVYERSKKWKNKDRMYRADQRVGSKYRGTSRYRGRLSKALKSPQRERSIFERSKRFAKSGSIYQRRYHRKNRYTNR
jgi:hypothetical protein